MAKALLLGSECPAGHALVGENVLWVTKRGGRVFRCLTCERARQKLSRQQRAAIKKLPPAQKSATRPQKKRIRVPQMPEQQAERNLRRQITRARARLSPEQFAEWESDMANKWLKTQNSPSAPWNVQKAKAPDEFTALNKKFDVTRGDCFNNPEPWVGYDDPRWPEEDTGKPMPTDVEAELLCLNCPVYALCGVWAEVEKPAWGVVAGKRWIDGKVVV